jgi:hypothetical protein
LVENVQQCSKTLKINPHLGFHVLLRKGLTVGFPTMLQNFEDKSTSGIPFSSEKGRTVGAQNGGDLSTFTMDNGNNTWICNKMVV